MADVFVYLSRFFFTAGAALSIAYLLVDGFRFASFPTLVPVVVTYAYDWLGYLINYLSDASGGPAILIQTFCAIVTTLFAFLSWRYPRR